MHGTIRGCRLSVLDKCQRQDHQGCGDDRDVGGGARAAAALRGRETCALATLGERGRACPKARPPPVVSERSARSRPGKPREYTHPWISYRYIDDISLSLFSHLEQEYVHERALSRDRRTGNPSANPPGPAPQGAAPPDAAPALPPPPPFRGLRFRSRAGRPAPGPRRADPRHA